jgi:hypothetical protein
MRWTWGAALLVLGACEDVGTIKLDEPVEQIDDAPSDGDPTDTEPTDTEPTEDTEEPVEEPVDPEIARYEGAVLVVEAPEPAEIDDDADGLLILAGHIESPAGATLPFDDVVWRLVETGEELFVGVDGEASVDFGIWTIEASAELPNGDTLRTVIGGIRVQAPRTGVYAGSIAISAVLNGLGVPLSTTCQGSLSFEVDMSGEVIRGDGGCQLDFLGVGVQFGLDYDFNGQVNDPGANGNLVIDTGFIGVPVGWAGTFRQGNELGGQFDGFGIGLFGLHPRPHRRHRGRPRERVRRSLMGLSLATLARRGEPLQPLVGAKRDDRSSTDNLWPIRIVARYARSKGRAPSTPVFGRRRSNGRRGQRRAHLGSPARSQGTAGKTSSHTRSGWSTPRSGKPANGSTTTSPRTRSCVACAAPMTCASVAGSRPSSDHSMEAT